LPKGDLDEVDADGMVCEVGHLAAGNSRGYFDDPALAVGRHDYLREGDPVAQAERVNCRGDGLLGALELIAEERRGIEVRPPDAETDPGWAQAVGQRQQLDASIARDRETVQLEPVVERLDNCLAAAGLRQGGVEVRVEIVRRVEPEDAALPARVGGLEHRRQAGRLQRRVLLAQPAQSCERRLRDAALREQAPHRDLVRHEVRGLRADPRQPERLRDRGDDRDRAVCGHGQHAVDLVPARSVGDRLDVGEVDDVPLVGCRQAGRVRIAVDGDDA
jgi:hypothetical protein